MLRFISRADRKFPISGELENPLEEQLITHAGKLGADPLASQSHIWHREMFDIHDTLTHTRSRHWKTAQRCEENVIVYKRFRIKSYDRQIAE